MLLKTIFDAILRLVLRGDLCKFAGNSPSKVHECCRLAKVHEVRSALVCDGAGEVEVHHTLVLLWLLWLT